MHTSPVLWGWGRKAPDLPGALRMKDMQNYKILFQEIPWEYPLAGARFKAYGEERKKLRPVEFTDELIEPDWCKKGHLGYVLSGKMEINFDGKIISYEAGDGIYIPPGENHKHMVTVASGTVRLILVEET